MYVLSTGRAGSTFLTGLLGRFGLTGITHQVRGSRTANVLGTLVVSQRLPVTVAARVASGALEGDVLASTADPLRSCLLWGMLRTTCLTQCRILHLVRDPRDVVRSFMNWKGQRFRRQLLHHVVPFWQPNPWLAGEMTLGSWLKMGKFEHFCWIWQFKNRLFEELESTCPYRRIHMEQFVRQETRREIVRDISEFLDLPLPEDVVLPFGERANVTSKRTFPPWQAWSAQRARALDRWCGGLMQRYGYGWEASWRGKVGQETGKLPGRHRFASEPEG